MTITAPTRSSATSIVELFERQTAALGDRTLYRYTSIAGQELAHSTFGDTFARAKEIATFLQGELESGAPVLLLFPPGLDFTYAFLGCLLAGVIAVPVAPPSPHPGRIDQELPRLRSVIRSAGTELVLSDGSLRRVADRVVAGIPELHGVPWFATDELPRPEGRWRRPTVDGRSVALLQFTSGSTSAPKGVVVTHGNLLANLEQQARALALGDDVRAVCWLPFYHDLGLISGLCLTIYCGGETTFISPSDFIRRPVVWLRAISRYRANLAGGPDFSYALCARRTRPEEISQLDLSCWRHAFIGAEPVRATTIERFTSTFAEAGFRPETFAPGYGLAEATLLVTMTPPERAPRIVDFDTAALAGGRAVPASGPSTTSTPLVSCGPPAPGVDVRIVAPDDGSPLPEGHVGEIWVRGANVAAGYWRNPDTSAFGRVLPTGEAGFLRTGDLGFVRAGELHVTGRLKDLIIIHGRNHSPSDIEQTVEAHPIVLPGACAAFPVDSGDGEELVVMAETRTRATPDELAGLPAVFDAVSGAVRARHGIAVKELVLIPAATMPRTSSGKIRRHAARAGHADGSIERIATLSPAGVVPAGPGRGGR